MDSEAVSVAPDEAAERQARGLKHDHTNSDVDRSEQRCGSGE